MWEDLNFFVGSWQGSGKGQPGISHVERSYQFVLNNKFLEVKNKSIWAPKIDNPEGEVHEDFGVISFDTARKSFIFRQFHVEGFVNQYVLNYLSQDGNTIVFTTESIENIATGWRAKETYRINSPDEFTEIFELAAPEKDFEVYSQCDLKRTARKPSTNR